MSLIKGITVILIDKVEIDKNNFNAPIYEDIEIPVDNVLVSPSSANEVVDSNNLYGKTAVYTLGIPKGDAHEWEDREVIFFGKKWKTFGTPLEGIEALIPLEWNKKVMVHKYE